MGKGKYLTYWLTISVVSALIMTLLAVFSTAASNTGPQSWSFDSEAVGDASQMERNWGEGDDGQSGSISIPGTGVNYHVWVSDQRSDCDVTYSSGGWVFQIRSTRSWGTDGSGCGVEIGYWDGSFHSLTPTPTVSTRGQNGFIIATLVQTHSITIPERTYLAVKVINNTGLTQKVFTGENSRNSFLRSPETDPGYPIPEFSAAALLVVGLAGLGTYLSWRRRKPS